MDFYGYLAMAILIIGLGLAIWKKKELYKKDPAEILSTDGQSMEGKTLKKEGLQGYKPLAKLPKGAKYLIEDLMTYEEMLKRCPDIRKDPNIKLNKKVWVIQLLMPAGESTKKKKRVGGVTFTVYDASTGKTLVSSVKALVTGKEDLA